MYTNRKIPEPFNGTPKKYNLAAIPAKENPTETTVISTENKKEHPMPMKNAPSLTALFLLTLFFTCKKEDGC